MDFYFCDYTSRPISRVLSKAVIYLRLLSPVASSDLPTGQRRVIFISAPAWSCSGWGLHSQLITQLLVSSYLTFPPLPELQAVYLCCTFPGVASAGCYPALCPVVLGLSSPALAGAVAFLTQNHILLSNFITDRIR